MGTRSTVKFYNEFSEDNNECVMCVYHQFDGYMTGVGFELAKFLNGKTIVNGIGVNQTMEQGYANGMCCLAAQYVVKFKKTVGGFYMSHMDGVESYNYEVRLVNSKIIIKVDDIFEGTPDELLNFKE